MEEIGKDTQGKGGEGKAAPTGVSAKFTGPTQLHYKKIPQDVSPP
jgi:hypothetical protein